MEINSDAYENIASLRDYFAMNCPQSQINKPNWRDIMDFKKIDRGTDIKYWKSSYSKEYECAERYKYADMMLKVRKRKP